MVEPEVFGRAVVTWKPLARGASEDVRDQLQASKTQHSVVLAMRRIIRQRNLSVLGYADLNDINYQRLSAVLRGQQVMRLEDIANAERNLGLAPEDWALQLSNANESPSEPVDPPSS